MSDDIRFTREENLKNGNVVFSAELPRDAGRFTDALEARILDRLASAYIEAYGPEIIAKIDMTRLGEQINGKVLGAALAQLAKDSR